MNQAINRRSDIPQSIRVDNPKATLSIQPTYSNDTVVLTGTYTVPTTVAAVSIGEAYDGYEATVINNTNSSANVRLLKRNRQFTSMLSVTTGQAARFVFNKVTGWLRENRILTALE